MQQDEAEASRLGYQAILKRRRHYYEQGSNLSNPDLLAEVATLRRLNNKVKAYEWVTNQGHAVAPHGVHPSLADALRSNELDRFVVKPVSGHSSKGVYLLRRRARGGYTCAMTGWDYASDLELEARHAKLASTRKDPISTEVILEAYLEDAQGYDVPLDYKVYAFASGTPIMMQRYAPLRLPRSEWGFEFYDEEGARLGPIRCGVPSGERWKLRPPPNLQEMFRTARALIATARVSFLRVDLYSTPAGVVFGEFTPVPNKGNESYVPSYDRLLGEMWLRSLDMLGLRYR